MGDNSNRGWGSSVRAFWSQSRTLSQYHIKVFFLSQAVENDPNQTLQATVGSAVFDQFSGCGVFWLVERFLANPHRA